VPVLRAHPLAELGSVFHALLERCVKGQLDRRGAPGDDAARALEEMLDDADRRLSERLGSDAPRLRELLPYVAWRRKRRAVLNLAERYLVAAKPVGGTSVGGGKRRADELPQQGTWAEVDFEVPALRLRGRADLVERDGGIATVRDLKTGRVVDTDGQVLPHIERQLQLYGLMASATWPTSEIRLVIDYGEEHALPFDDLVREQTRAWLGAILSRLPAGSSFPADALATPGSACVGCPFRHVCGAYRAWAPTVWREGGEVGTPTDTWGEVVERNAYGPDAVQLALRDEAQRLIKVFHARSAVLREAAVGDHIWIFNLLTRDRHVGDGKRRHPLNFYETDPNDPTDRAWAIQVFHTSTSD
jgi:RecB family exonuclease